MKWLSYCIGILLFCACSTTLPIRDGATAMDRKQYAVAIALQPKEFAKAKSKKDKAQIAWRQGEAYRILGIYADAGKWYRTAFENGYGAEALRAQAQTLKAREQYEEAIVVFKELGAELGSQYEVKREISNCQAAATWLKAKDSTGIRVTALPLNTSASEYAAIYNAKGQIIFTSDRPNDNKKTYHWTGRAFHDFWLAENEESSQSISLGAPFNTSDNEGAIVYGNDGTYCLFTRCPEAEKLDQYCGLFESSYIDGAWTEPIALRFFESASINVGQPALSGDAQILVFSAETTDGWGGRDLFFCNRTREQSWSDPVLLPRSINTGGNEQFPVFDGDTLYFSSDGLIGMGGLDIFKTWIKAGQWAPPQNLRSPINSGADDAGFVPSKTVDKDPDIWRHGLLWSNRGGNDDIYAFQQGKPIPPPVLVNVPKPKPTEYKIELDLYVLEKIYAIPGDPNSKVLSLNPLPDAEVKGWKDKLISPKEGPISLQLASNEQYVFTATLPGYLRNEVKFSTVGIKPDAQNPVLHYDLELVLDKIYRNREIVLENIYYDYNRAEIRTDAKPTLLKLANILRQNPEIKIQLASHTDCRGSDAYNLELSQRRAESAVRFLIEQGIESSRLVAVGFGETKPADNCDCNNCSEAQYQTNRRTTFTILD